MQTNEYFPAVSFRWFFTAIFTAVIFVFAVSGNLSAAETETELPVLVEAEGFADTGGWVIDPQFMDMMGSPRIPLKYDAKKDLWVFNYMIPMTFALPKGEFTARVEVETETGEKYQAEKKVKTY